MPQTFKDAVVRNVNEFRSLTVWRAVLAEFLGTAMLVFIGCSVCLKDWEKNKPTMVQISLTFGLAVSTVVWCIAHVSGGHINPAVTVAMLLTRKMSVVKALLYIVAQSVGAIVGSAILKGLHPEGQEGDELGNTTLQKPVGPRQGICIELLITFVLVFTVFASCDKRRTDLGGSVPLTIGFSITLCHLFAIKYTGASMNPARSFGPAVVGTGGWEHHWVYWVGPITGGIIAGFIYEFVFSVDASIGKLKSMVSPGGPQEYELTTLNDDKARKADKV